jgi:hypothetical protein
VEGDDVAVDLVDDDIPAGDAGVDLEVLQREREEQREHRPV